MTEHENTDNDEALRAPWSDHAPSDTPPPPPPAPPAPTAQPTTSHPTDAQPPFPQTTAPQPFQPPAPPSNVPTWPQAPQAQPSFGGAIGGGVPPTPPAAGADAYLSPAASPVLSGQYGITEPPSAPDVPETSSKLPWIAAMVGALVLLGGGGFFALTAFGASGGAETPEAAVDAMFEALGNEDFITLGELLEPSERRTIVEPTITEVLPELIRVGIFSEEIDAGNVEGIDFEFTDVTYRVEPLAQNPDIVHVYLTGGQVATEFNAAEFPFSDLLREELGSELEDQPRETEPIEESDTPLTFVERDGRWYFSGLFSAAEAARLDAGERLPRTSESPAALGSATPDAAVEAMFQEISDWDLAGLIGRMDPEEMAVLYRYSPLFLDEAQTTLDEAEADVREADISWELRDFDFEVETDGDDAVVAVRGFTLDVRSPDIDLTFTYGRDEISGRLDANEFDTRGSFTATTTRLTIEGVVDGEQFNVEIVVDPDGNRISGSGSFSNDTAEGEVTFDPNGVCSRYSLTASDGTSETGCIEDSFDADDRSAFGFYENAFDDWPSEFPGFSISTHKTDGEWYISPIGTAFDGYLAVLRNIEDDQLQELFDSAGALDGLDAMGAFDDVVNDALGSDSTTSSQDIQDFEDLLAELESELDEDAESSSTTGVPSTAEPVRESTIEMTIDRGATATLDDSLSAGGFDIATVDLEAGDTVIITAETDGFSNLDTTLTLTFEATGAVVGFNDDADSDAGLAGLFDSKLEVQVLDTGTYTIEIASFDYESSGEYSLTVERR